MKKYQLTDESIDFQGKLLYRIKALQSFGNVEAGELGGFIEKEENLSQKDNAWVYGNAGVFGNAWVYGDARVFGDADMLQINCIGSRHGTTTFFKTEVGIGVTCGCFKGSIEDFEKKVSETHGDNEHAQAYRLAMDLAKLRIKV